MKKPAVLTSELRKFGWVVGGIFLCIGLAPLLAHHSVHLWAVTLGSALLLSGSVLPESLRSIHTGWMVVGGVLGWINTRLILGLAFFLVLTPLAILRRLFSRDKSWFYRDAGVPTYATPVKKRTDDHFIHTF